MPRRWFLLVVFASQFVSLRSSAQSVSSSANHSSAELTPPPSSNPPSTTTENSAAKSSTTGVGNGTAVSDTYAKPAAITSGAQSASTSTLRLSYLPRPYFAFGPELMPGGYASLAFWGEGGLDLESRHVISTASGSYDNGHKTNDGTQPNPKGHDRSLQGNVYWRLAALTHGNWLAGGGYRWSQLSTTNYAKGAARPSLGAGYDLYSNHSHNPECRSCGISARLTADYLFTGTDRQNGTHGVEFAAIIPRPVEPHHVFFKWSFSLDRYHTTVTAPSDLALTQQQLAQRFWDGTCSLGAMYRF